MEIPDLKDKVTIGIPVYNEVRFIRETLESAIIQGATVIVSDNASTDGTSEICREYADRGLIKYIRQNGNIGSWGNFSYLALNSTNPYFMWLGGHDLLSSGYVQKLYNAMLPGSDYLLCASNTYQMIDHEGRSLGVFKNFRSNFLDSGLAFRRVWGYVTSDAFNAVFYGLYRLRAVQEYMRKYQQEILSGGSDNIFLARLLVQGKIFCSDSIPWGYSVRKNRDEENFSEMMQRQLNVIGHGDSWDSFLGNYIKRQADVLEETHLPGFIKKKMQKSLDKILRRRVVLSLLKPEVEAFAKNDLTLEALGQKREIWEKKINITIPSSVFWDLTARVCLGNAIQCLGSRQISWREYRTIQKTFYEQGLRIPFMRRIKWIMKYHIWKRICLLIVNKSYNIRT